VASADKCWLHFIALNASLSRQFEFNQSAWITGTHFNGLSGESDLCSASAKPMPPTG
jgi:hypothetical protein